MSPPRDYYADLELPPTADVQEIKKQFRKLALKYHPDRNPGREQEVNTKFQVIQTAHEILTDPQQKAKYDATVGRSSRYPASSGVRGNPWANVGQQFPTPPRRNQGPRTTASGAQKWQRFSSGVPPTAKQQTNAESEAKKNAAKAFEGMRKGNTSTNTRPSQREPRPGPPPPPRSETARQRAQASFGNRKSGYYPHSDIPGDQPQSGTHNYRPVPLRPGEQASAPPPQPQPRPAPMQDPLRQFREATGSDNRQSTPYTTHGGEKTNPFDGIPLSRAKSTKETFYRSQSPDQYTASRTRRSSSVPRSSTQDSSGSRLGVPQDERRPRSADEQDGSQSKNSFASRVRSASRGDEAAEQGDDQDPRRPSLFNIPPENNYPQDAPDARRFTKGSVDDINTKFANDADPRVWQFSAGNPSSDVANDSGSRDHSTSGRDSPPKTEPPRRSSKSVPDLQSANAEGAFNAGGWSDKFGPETFVPRPDPGTSASPTRSTRANSKKSRPTRPTVGTAAVVEESSDDDVYQWAGRRAHGRGSTVESPQAMDIDSPPLEPTEDATASNSARNVHVEPSKPEWRSGDFEASKTANEEPPKEHFDPNAAGSEDSEEFRASFADLKNVAPFNQSGTGLKSFSDLKDNLPFESKASAETPVKLPKAAPLVFPHPPQPPRLPPTVAIPGMIPNKPSWKLYLDEFTAYLKLWDEFNGQVADHFATRKLHIDRQRNSKGYDFLGLRSDHDVQEYYSWIQQDNDVRRRWTEACEEHERHFRAFLAFREKMK